MGMRINLFAHYYVVENKKNIFQHT